MDEMNFDMFMGLPRQGQGTWKSLPPFQTQMHSGANWWRQTAPSSHKEPADESKLQPPATRSHSEVWSLVGPNWIWMWWIMILSQIECIARVALKHTHKGVAKIAKFIWRVRYKQTVWNFILHEGFSILKSFCGSLLRWVKLWGEGIMKIR
jgi:hypothetical protein